MFFSLFHLLVRVKGFGLMDGCFDGGREEESDLFFLWCSQIALQTEELCLACLLFPTVSQREAANATTQ